MERYPREGGVEYHSFCNSKYLLEPHGGSQGALLYISEDLGEGVSPIYLGSASILGQLGELVQTSYCTFS